MEKTKQVYFNEFAETVKKDIISYLPSEYADAKAEIQKVMKNNDTVLNGLVIRKEDNGISPTIYLEDYFKSYKDGTKMEDILTQLADVYLHAQTSAFNSEKIVAMVMDYSAVKDHLLPRLISRAFNEKRLEGMPYTSVNGDLAVTYHIQLENTEEGSASIAITNEIFKNYNVSIEELHETALKNMKVLTPACFCPISQVLCGIMGIPEEEMAIMVKPEEESMFVLSCEQKTFGAAWLLDMEQMKKCKEQIGDFVILPSSVHETILVKLRDLKEKENMVEELNTMVREVNATQVAPNEILSDHIYRIDWEKEALVTVDENFKAGA